MAAEPLDDEPTRATSIRLPASEHRAVMEAVEAGMDPSFTEAVRDSLRERVRVFERRQALADLFHRHPEDVPTLEEVAARRVSGSDHPAATRPDLIARAAASVGRRRPGWVVSGDVDTAVDDVLFAVEVLIDAEEPE